MHSYLISLKDRPDKLRNALKILDSVDIHPEIHEAIKPIERGCFLVAGQLGCYQSHLEVLKKIVERKEDGVFAVIEDDILLGKQFKNHIDEIQTRFLASDADLVYLHNGDSNLYGGEVALERAPRQCATHFLLIKGSSAKKIYDIMIQKFLTYYDPHDPIDCDLWDPRIIKMRTTHTFALQDSFYDSDISSEKLKDRISYKGTYPYLSYALPEPHEVDGDWYYNDREIFYLHEGYITHKEGEGFYRIEGNELIIRFFSSDRIERISLTHTNGILDKVLQGDKAIFRKII